MRVLITGGYGGIGGGVIRRLLGKGAGVWVYDLREDAKRLGLVLGEKEVSQVRFVQGDVTDLERLKSTIAEHRITHVIHLAGLQVPTCRANPILGAHVNVVG